MSPSPEKNLDRALDQDELVLHYQPILDSRTKRVVSAEALLRWDHPDHGTVGAVQLAAAAEKGSRIFRLEHWSMVRAFHEAASWMRSHDVRLNLNLSAREFLESEVVAALDSAIEASGIDPTRVNLEITEKSFIRELESVATVLREIKARGMQLWLDDFGTGHSSILHLKHFPVDGIKIPGAYVEDVATDRISHAIVRSLIHLATDLGLQVIAEEVETEEQLAVVTDAGCYWIQGFLFAKPMKAQELDEEIARRNG